MPSSTPGYTAPSPVEDSCFHRRRTYVDGGRGRCKPNASIPFHGVLLLGASRDVDLAVSDSGNPCSSFETSTDERALHKYEGVTRRPGFRVLDAIADHRAVPSLGHAGARNHHGRIVAGGSGIAKPLLALHSTPTISGGRRRARGILTLRNGVFPLERPMPPSALRLVRWRDAESHCGRVNGASAG